MFVHWNRQERLFYLHEDEWSMIDLLPEENFEDLMRTAAEAKAFGEEHFDGFGWTAMYVIPKPTHPLALRTLPLHELQELLGERFLAARSIQSGYSTYRESLPDGFAFVEAEQADGVLYGQQKSGLVTGLHLLPCDGANHDRTTSISDTLHTLGTKYDLVLVDWWKDIIVDLQDRTTVVSYLEASSQQE
jgi:hypothetical protein